MRLILLFFVFLVALAVFALAMAATGILNVSAVKGATPVDGFLNYAAVQSIRRHAPTGTNPYARNPDALKVGMDHFKEMCIGCHGAPGMEPDELAKGLNPPAPLLTSPFIQKMTDGEIYWVIANGIRMTAMPGFIPTHSPEKIWDIEAFVRHLPNLTAEEKKQLSSH